MPDNFGSTFQPDDQNNRWRPGAPGGGGGAPSGGGGAGFSPVQQAVKVLSLRLPQVFGAQAPISPGLMTGGQYSHAGPTQSSAVAQSYYRGQMGGGAPGAPPVTGGYMPPAISDIIKKRLQGMPNINLPTNIPGEAANLGQILGQLPHMPPPPNISMSRPGGPVGGGGYATQIPQPPQMASYTPPPGARPTNPYQGSYNPYGGGYTAPGGGFTSGPMFRSPYA